MSCRTLVVAFILLGSCHALAQAAGDEPGAGQLGSDAGAAAGSLATPAVETLDQGLVSPVIDPAAAVADAGAEAPARGLPPGCPVDTNGDDVAEGIGECPPPGRLSAPPWRVAAPRSVRAREEARRRGLSDIGLTMDFETVVGANTFRIPGLATVVASSSLATARYRPAERFSCGAVVPFLLSYGYCLPGEQCGGPTAGWETGNGLYGHLGAIALFGTWEGRWRNRAGTTRIPVGVLVALPTASNGPVETAYAISGMAEIVEATRGHEDGELFSRGFALVPSAAMLHDFGRVTVSASVKVPLRLIAEYTDDLMFAVDVVGAAQVMVKALDDIFDDGRRAVLLAGVRAVAMGGARSAQLYDENSRPASRQYYLAAVNVALEPRIEAHLGALDLRAGFLIPLEYARWDLPSNSFSDSRFPVAWGVRVGVGYSF